MTAANSASRIGRSATLAWKTDAPASIAGIRTALTGVAAVLATSCRTVVCTWSAVATTMEPETGSPRPAITRLSIPGLENQASIARADSKIPVAAATWSTANIVATTNRCLIFCPSRICGFSSATSGGKVSVLNICEPRPLQNESSLPEIASLKLESHHATQSTRQIE